VNGWTPLLEAADEGSLETLNFLLESGADINWHQGPNSPTALSMAASEGKKDCLLALLNAGADMNGFGESLPPLHAAAKEGKTDLMHALITRGADVNQSDAVGRTALMYAASEGLGDPVSLLISSKANPNLSDYTGMRAVEFALEEGAEDLAHFLALITEGPVCATHLKDGHTHSHFDIRTDSDVHVDLDMDVSGKQYGWSKEDEKRSKAAMKRAEENATRQELAMERAEEAALRQEIRQKQLERSLENSNRDRSSVRVIDAIDNRNNARLQRLLEEGANANSRDEEGKSALMRAILLGNVKAVALLLQNGADIESKSASGWAPLHLAALQGNMKVMALLLEQRPTVDARTNYSSTDGSPENSLLAWDYEGATPLLIAIENNNLDCTSLLLSSGANPELRMKKVEFTRVESDANGFDLSQVTNVEERLRKTNTTTTTYENWTPRLQAVQLDNPKILALL